MAVIPTPEHRPPAPGRLGVLQEFMNSAHLGGRVSPELAAAVNERREQGASRAAIASEFGLGQKFVSAIGRGARPDDDLATPKNAKKWLSERDLMPGSTSVGTDGLARLRELRELLRKLAEANNGHPLEPGALSSLDRIAAEAPLVVRFQSAADAALAPAGDGVGGAIGALLAIAYEGMKDGTFQRLKRCPGDGCPHTFYDASRNRTGTWCSMSVCGNRTKVRSYQSRRRAARPAARE